MIGFLTEWVEQRTGVKKLLHEALYENIPSGARWRYITGSMLVFAFSVQAITGIFLWMAYSPSSQTAYESVYYIQHEMTGGWLVRGIHHFMAQAMVVVLALHLLQVIVDGAYRAPREVNYWLGLVLMQLVMGLGLTGYLLPWDQKGYWATNVATNLMTLVPFAGKEIQQIALGGSEYGHHTLTRFFAMHTGVLPAALIGFLGLHIAVFRKHGITAKITPGRPDQYFWPHQVLMDAIGCLALLGIVLLCVIHFDVQGLIAGDLPREHRGAELGAPADPGEQFAAARPEWYYLFLFQLLKYFHGTQEIIGAIYIPGAVMTILALAPIIGRSSLGHRFNIVFILLLLLGAGGLTIVALREDAANPDFQIAKKLAHRDAERTYELINRREVLPDGKLSEARLIPKEGAVYLLRNDPLTRGPRLFAQHCASCHDYRKPDGTVPAATAFTPPNDAATLVSLLADEPAPTQEKPADEKSSSKPSASEAAPEDHAHAHNDHAELEPTSFNLLQSPQVTPEGKVVRDAEGKVVYAQGAFGGPNLYGFGSRDWVRGILDPQKITAISYGQPKPAKDPKVAADSDNPENHKRPVYADYFGNTNHVEGRMVKWVQSHAKELADDPAKTDDDLDAIVAALSAQAGLRAQQELETSDAQQQLIGRGVTLIEKHCTNECHRFGDSGQLGLAPDLTGWGSYEWMMGLISDPTDERFYRRENDRMPSFAKDLEHPATHNVSLRELSLIVDWIRGDYYQASDEKPVLPHSEDRARELTLLARATPVSSASVIGVQPRTLTQKAEQIFATNCASCHSHTDATGVGIAAKKPSAPNLYGIASRQWLAGILDPKQVDGPKYFGNTMHFEDDMVGFVKDNLSNLDDAKKKDLEALIAALSAEAKLPAQAEADAAAASDGTIEKGKTVLTTSWASSSCVDCHKFGDDGDLGSAPDLTGYGSLEWLEQMIANPEHERLYVDNNDRMPKFGVGGPGAKQSILADEEITLLARWLRGEKLDEPATAASK